MINAIHITTKTGKGREQSYVVRVRDRQQARPWLVRDLYTGSDLGSFKTLEAAKRSLNKFITDCGEVILSEKES